MARQLTLPGIPPKPRKPRLWRMKLADAGHLPSGEKGIQFVCPRCGHDTGWILDEQTITENRRGLPCPQCNVAAGEAQHEAPVMPSGPPPEETRNECP